MPRIQRWIAGLEVLLALGVTILAGLVVSGVASFWFGAGTPPSTAPIRPHAGIRSAPPDAETVLAALGHVQPPASDSASGSRVWGIAMRADVPFAVLEDERGAQRLAAIGDAVDDGTIVDIDWDGVTIERNGRRRRLHLETRPREEPSSDTAPPNAPATTPPSPDVRQVSEGSFLVDRRTLLGQAGSMSGLLSQLRAVPEIRDGEPIGFRVFAINDDSIFRRLGLRDGDVVRRVNGNMLHDPAALLAFLDGMGDASRIALDLVRSGHPTTLVYDLR